MCQPIYILSAFILCMTCFCFDRLLIPWPTSWIILWYTSVCVWTSHVYPDLWICLWYACLLLTTLFSPDYILLPLCEFLVMFNKHLPRSILSTCYLLMAFLGNPVYSFTVMQLIPTLPLYKSEQCYAFFSSILTEIKIWFDSNFLQLNKDKTEVLLVAIFKSKLAKLLYRNWGYCIISMLPG